MSVNYNNYEDQPTDELLYGRCRCCRQIEELNEEELCLVCEGQVQRESKLATKKLF